MSSNYYDVVVLGMEIGPLCAGALLARRGFRVLVVGQGSSNEYYSCCGYQFARRPFLLTGVHSPVIRRVMDELNLGQLLQRSFSETHPRFQVVLPSARINVYDDVARTAAEISRECTEGIPRVTSLLTEIGRLSSEFEKILSNDLVIPPESFFERRDFARAEVQNPFFQAPETDLVQMLGLDRELKDFFCAPVRSETGSVKLGALVQSRQIGAWMFDSVALQGGRDTLRRLLCERITGQGGDIQAGATIVGIDIHRGRVRSIRVAGREEPTACQCVLTAAAPGELAGLISPTGWPGRFRALVEDDLAETSPQGYALNLGVDAEVIPEGMADHVILCAGPGEGAELLRVERIACQAPGQATLHVSCLVPSGMEGQIESGELRDSILDRIRWLVPFLDHHLNVIHSPYDRSGALCFRELQNEEVPPPPHAEAVPRWRVHRPRRDSALGMSGQPHRTGIKGLYLSGGQVVSGLSVEGEFIAAWGVARIAGAMDPGRHRLLRSLRTSVEF